MTRARLLLCSLALAAFFPAGARAGVDWTYDFTPSTTTVWSDSGNSKINLTNQSSLLAVGTSDVVATQLSVNSAVSDDHPDTFTHKDYSLSMKLTDLASGAFTTLTFSGYFQGTVSAHSANILNFFTGQTSYDNIMLGGNRYNVTMTNFTPPGPGGGLEGAIGAHAVVSVQPGGGPHNTPEPTSLVLAGLGLIGAGLARRRRD